MTLAVVLIISLAVLALIGTILAAKDHEQNYNHKTKGNVTRLTSIYAIVIIISILAVGLYIVLR